MAKKTGKGKEKKLARKAETGRIAALSAQLRSLNEASAAGEQLAAQYPAFQQYNRKGLAAGLRFYGSRELPAAILGWALGLTRDHMAELYQACPDWGWSEARKREELADPAARHVVVFQQPEQQQQPAMAEPSAEQPPQQQHAHETSQQQDGEQQLGHEQQQAQHQAGVGSAAPVQGAAAGQENQAAAGNGGGSGGIGEVPAQTAAELGQPVAFVHFRYEEEEGEAVLYCYEIQVAAAAQGKGLGRFLMQLLELMGRKAGVSRLMLTVFHDSQAAVALYTKLGYVLDNQSPGALSPSGDHKYEIMTKRLQPKGAGQA